MIYHTRKLVKPEDLNPGGSLFGGTLLCWIDEEAAIYVMCQLDSKNVVTKFMSEIHFVSPARTGDVVEIGFSSFLFEFKYTNYAYLNYNLINYYLESTLN